MTEKVSRDHKISFMWGLKDRVVKAGDLTPMKAIRYKCIDCSGGSTHEVKLCVCADCPLWPFRLGHNPFRRERQLTPDQRTAIAQRFATARSKPR